MQRSVPRSPQLEQLLAHLDAGGRSSDFPGELPAELEPLTTKPLIVVVNGPGGIDVKLEPELAELDPDGGGGVPRRRPSALEEVVRRLFDALDLITFFTAGDNETRAWTLRRGQTALDAADEIHSDIARGFIRCEVIRWSRLRRERLARRSSSGAACSGWRARTTSSRTATCCTSASTSDSAVSAAHGEDP